MSKARKINLSFLEELRNETSPQMSIADADTVKTTQELQVFVADEVQKVIDRGIFYLLSF